MLSPSINFLLSLSSSWTNIATFSGTFWWSLDSWGDGSLSIWSVTDDLVLGSSGRTESSVRNGGALAFSTNLESWSDGSILSLLDSSELSVDGEFASVGLVPLVLGSPTRSSSFKPLAMFCASWRSNKNSGSVSVSLLLLPVLQTSVVTLK